MIYARLIIVLFGFVFTQEYDYSLEDINSSSPSYNQYLSPGTFSGQITLHYFGHQN